MDRENYDVIIVGGSYAGLAAAMGLGRAIRKVLIIDSGRPCNIQTPHSHNFLTQDGRTPAEIRDIALKQVLNYPTVKIHNDEVTTVTGSSNAFQVATASGNLYNSKKILFATGVKDQMPSIEGFSSCWGISVIHCPYCHGYEYRNQPTAILIDGDMAFEFGRMIHNWTKDLTILTNGTSTISAEHLEAFASLNVRIIESEVINIIHEKGYLSRVNFADATSLNLSVVYARLPFVQHCDVPAELGCTLTEPGYLLIDEMQRTTVPGIFAAGDNTTPMRAVAGSVAQGTKAAAFINHELIAEQAITSNL
jgi:thioredoxin reductase